MKFEKCRKCNKEWNISILNDTEYYICPACRLKEEKEHKKLVKKKLDKNRRRI